MEIKKSSSGPNDFSLRNDILEASKKIIKFGFDDIVFRKNST